MSQCFVGPISACFLRLRLFQTSVMSVSFGPKGRVIRPDSALLWLSQMSPNPAHFVTLVGTKGQAGINLVMDCGLWVRASGGAGTCSGAPDRD